jgi:hypothetical protein
MYDLPYLNEHYRIMFSKLRIVYFRVKVACGGARNALDHGIESVSRYALLGVWGREPIPTA